MHGYEGINFQLLLWDDKVSKSGRCEPENVERDLDSVRNGDVGLNAASCACSSKTT